MFRRNDPLSRVGCGVSAMRPVAWPAESGLDGKRRKPHIMRAHWRRWLAGGLGLLAVLLCLTVIVPPQAGGGTPDKPTQLAVNLVSHPMAVPAGQGIWFSWAARDARRGETQHGYQLRVAASPDRLFDGD